MNRLEPNSDTASQIETKCDCASGCNNWVDLSSPPPTSSSPTVLNNAELCSSPCNDVIQDLANAECEVIKVEICRRMLFIVQNYTLSR